MRVLYQAQKDPSIGGKTITTNRTGLKLDGQTAWEVPNENPDWLFPWTSWSCVVEDQYILQAYGYEHTKGGDVGHSLAVLDATGQLISDISGHFCEGAVFTRPDKNHRLAWIHLVEYWQGNYGYNTLINAGQPPLVVNTYSLPKMSRTNRWLVEVPETLKSQYNADHIRYKKGNLIEEKNEIFVESNPMTKTAEQDLTFRVAFPWQ